MYARCDPRARARDAMRCDAMRSSRDRFTARSASNAAASNDVDRRRRRGRDFNAPRAALTAIECVLARRYLMYYMNEKGERVYTLKVRGEACARARREEW